MPNLSQVLAEQKKYNDKIRARNPEPLDKMRSKWTETYLLGIADQIHEILHEIDWKKHRKEDISTNEINVAYELADITKYTLSLWELWGFNATDILDFVALKSRVLELKSSQEFDPIPTDVPIVITDIDGTLGDWRATFVEWLHSKGVQNVLDDPATSLNMDSDLSMLYTEYSDLKEEFESSGKYRDIEIYKDSKEVLQRLKEYYGAYIIAITARPSEQYRRIWMDTWLWIEHHKLPIDQLRIGSESRVILAHSLNKTQPVIMLEDNPSLIMRGANSGLRIFARRQRYNERIVDHRVRIVDSYSEIGITEFFPYSIHEERE